MSNEEEAQFSASVVIITRGAKAICYLNVWEGRHGGDEPAVVVEEIRVLLDDGKYEAPEWIRDVLVGMVESL